MPIAPELPLVEGLAVGNGLATYCNKSLSPSEGLAVGHGLAGLSASLSFSRQRLSQLKFWRRSGSKFRCVVERPARFVSFLERMDGKTSCFDGRRKDEQVAWRGIFPRFIGKYAPFIELILILC